ncbi:lysophospholipid transporter LplT [Sulfuriferula plumbiphila]|uniref:Lysophospholipid transporter LplT n=1 Tax=Sulfuriferula plumbiphila TaxID=171865 RepID=A0A512LAF5_9PROT|nr:lysophospholipid transporter LplT [Sulfuriferula plumbiphila]BBP04967.1 lysophospholipid transporter LplT [Sulfuriferula plumbiphila]GEP31466.1 lysophospholipid transporter LplT [Sulfuriferula plumbiphila]
MNLGFYIILSAQFLSALADNALLFAAIALLQDLSAPSWHTPVLQEFFVISYIVLAPFVGAFADALPKGRVMFISNNIKLIGCFAMLAGLNPLYAYGIVGFGAAAYSPAKYGILTEYLPPAQLVAANAWMEGATVAAIVLGAILGGLMLNADISGHILMHLPFLGDISVAKLAIVLITLLYIAAALANLFIPCIAMDHRPPKRNPLFLLHDFWHSFKLLWRDPLGQVTLAVTTLFWGVGATLRLVILTWAGLVLKYDMQKATQLTAVVAVGIAIGSVLAGRYIKLQDSIKVLPAGIVMGFVVIGMMFVSDPLIAAGLLMVIGGLGGFFVVPMNALLQHRGHLLMGAGHSIAVQNFNENLSILVLLGFYALMDRAGWPMDWIIIAFGGFISLSMLAIQIRFRRIGGVEHI